MLTTELRNNIGFYNDQGIITLPAKQFDTGRIFRFEIYNNGKEVDLTDTTPSLRINKADGTQFEGALCCSVIEKNIVEIDTSKGNGNQILAASGINQCELHFVSSSNENTAIDVTTWNFNIFVKERVHDGENLISENSWDILDSLLELYDTTGDFIITLNNTEKNINDLKDYISRQEVYSETQPLNEEQDTDNTWYQTYQ